MNKKSTTSSEVGYDLDGTLGQLVQHIQKQISAIHDGMDQESIHALRVEIKKLRAGLYLRFLLAGKKPKTKSFFAKTFERAGKVRSAYLHTVYLEPFSKELHTDSIAQKELEFRMQKFVAHTSQYTKEADKVTHYLQEANKHISVKRVKKYFHFMIESLEQAVAHAKGKKAYHGLRKQIKVILYNYALLPAQVQKQLHISVKYLDMLQQKTGDWHDTYAAMQFFGGQENIPEAFIREMRKKEKLQVEEMRKAFKKFGEKMVDG